MQRKIGRFIPNTNENKGGGVIKLKHKGIVSELKYNKNNEIYGKVKCPNASVCNNNIDNFIYDSNVIMYHDASRNFDKEQWNIIEREQIVLTDGKHPDLSNIRLYGLGENEPTYETNFAKLTSFNENFNAPNFASNANFYQYYIFELNLTQNTIKIVGYIHFFVRDYVTNRVLFYNSSKTLTYLEDTISKIELNYKSPEEANEEYYEKMNVDLGNIKYIYIDASSSVKSFSETIKKHIKDLKFDDENNNYKNFIKSLSIEQPNISITNVNGSFNYLKELINYLSDLPTKLSSAITEMNDNNNINFDTSITITAIISGIKMRMINLKLIIENESDKTLKPYKDDISLLNETILLLSDFSIDLINSSILIFINVLEVLLCILNNYNIQDQETWNSFRVSFDLLLNNITSCARELIIYLNTNKIKSISKNTEKEDFDLIIRYLKYNYKLISIILSIGKNTIGNDSDTNNYLTRKLGAYNTTKKENKQELYINFSDNIFDYLDIKYKKQPIKNVQEILDKTLEEAIYNDNLTISVKEKYRSDSGFNNFKTFKNNNNERICYMWDFYTGGVPDDNWECFYNWFLNIKLEQKENRFTMFDKRFNLINQSKSFAYTNTTDNNGETIHYYYICDLFNAFEKKLNDMIEKKTECSEMNLPESTDEKTKIENGLNEPGDFVTLV